MPAYYSQSFHQMQLKLHVHLTPVDSLHTPEIAKNVTKEINYTIRNENKLQLD